MRKVEILKRLERINDMDFKTDEIIKLIEDIKKDPEWK